MTDKPKTIDCPQCGRPARIDASNGCRPFCSKRCKLIDLGDWLDESNRIPDPRGTAAGASWDGPTTDDEPTH